MDLMMIRHVQARMGQPPPLHGAGQAALASSSRQGRADLGTAQRRVSSGPSHPTHRAIPLTIATPLLTRPLIAAIEARMGINKEEFMGWLQRDDDEQGSISLIRSASQWMRWNAGQFLGITLSGTPENRSSVVHPCVSLS